MGAKTQTENKKLNVPAPGAYDIPEKVSVVIETKIVLDNRKQRQNYGREDNNQAACWCAWTWTRWI